MIESFAGRLAIGSSLSLTLMRDGQCACGVAFTGPPNQKRCAACRVSKEKALKRVKNRRFKSRKRTGNYIWQQGR